MGRIMINHRRRTASSAATQGGLRHGHGRFNSGGAAIGARLAIDLAQPIATNARACVPVDGAAAAAARHQPWPRPISLQQ